ncbi:BRCA1-associated protein-like [Ptychodera flava]|uniref:BRCA1-associated protein-like n=1 Tax=Ptychodera flava TaxID=63121 RepID=UPI00396A652D
MSYSKDRLFHVALRIEIAEDFPVLPSLHFTAKSRMSDHASSTQDSQTPNNISSDSEKGITAKVNDNDPSKDGSHDEREGKEKKSVSALQCPDIIQLHRGKRQMEEITIETLAYQDVEKGATEENSHDHDEKDEIFTPEDGDTLNENSKKCSEDVSSTVKDGDAVPCHDDTKKEKNGPIGSKPHTYSEVVSAPSEKKKASVKLSCSSTDSQSSTAMEPGTSKSSHGNRPGSGSGRISHSPVTRVPSQVHFFSGNPSVEITKGILHLYKETFMTSLDEDTARSEMMVLLGVPAAMTIHDLVQFTAPVSPNIQMLRIIRDSTPNQYMVLIKFKEQKLADEFYKTYNGQPFNSIEPELCHCVYVARVETVKESEGAYLPIPGLTELPTCPVCLERMDESVDGILTILCNHSFHSSCLYKWGDTSCPVCRYSQAPEQVADNKCMICGAQESLWICLICGHIGCGRYMSAHAYQHFEETQHTYAMQLGNNRVWDYAGDNYVHRLVQSKGDGKIVEWDREDPSAQREEKVDSLTLEFTYLLTSQLESQRLYFEEQLARMEEKNRTEVAEVEGRCKKMVGECEMLEQKLSRISKERQTFERKFTQQNAKVKTLSSELTEEREINKCLRENQKELHTKLQVLERKQQQDQSEKDKEIQEMKEQLRDLMFFLEAQNQISNASEETRQEIQEGQIVMGAAAPAPAPDTRTHGRKGRKKGR